MKVYGALRSAWQMVPQWLRGIVCCLAIYAAMLSIGRAAGVAMTRFQLECLKTPARACVPPLVQAIVASVAFGPGLFLAGQTGGRVTAAVVALPAAVYSAIGGFCFHRFGQLRGLRLSVILILAVVLATVGIIFFPIVG